MFKIGEFNSRTIIVVVGGTTNEKPIGSLNRAKGIQHSVEFLDLEFGTMWRAGNFK